MSRRYDIRDRREQSSEGPALPRLAQTQIGRRLGATLWAPETELPDAFADALQRIKNNLS